MAELNPLPTAVGRFPQDRLDLDERVQAQVRESFAYVWRLLRRLGLGPTDAEDAAQQVFIVLAKKISELECGKERAFLYGTAVRIAWRARRTLERRREELRPAVDEEDCPSPAPDQILAQREARSLLDKILGSLPLDVRTVFVLFEVEGLSLTEIARALEIPRGTVASRLRRGRTEFRRMVRRVEHRRVESWSEA